MNWLPARRRGADARPSRSAPLRPERPAAGAARARRWAVAGALLGGLVAGVAFAPASWLAAAVARASDHHVLLAEAEGTVWNGRALLVLTGGPGSRDAATLPGKLAWTVRPAGAGLRLGLRQECCLNGEVALRVEPGPGRLRLRLEPRPGWLAQWPGSLLGGLGTPWNTLKLGGSVRLSSPGLVLEQAAGRWQLQGRADIDLLHLSSPLVTLEELGSYRFSLVGDGQGQVQAVLSTRDGALQLSGDGQLGAGGLRFRGEARAGAGHEAALDNLLNIIGRRDGARSIISIG